MSVQCSRHPERLRNVTVIYLAVVEIFQGKRGNMGKFCPRGTTVDVVVVPGVGQNYCMLAITFPIHFPPPCTLSAQNRHVEDRRKEAYKEKSVTLLRL